MARTRPRSTGSGSRSRTAPRGAGGVSTPGRSRWRSPTRCTTRKCRQEERKKREEKEKKEKRLAAAATAATAAGGLAATGFAGSQMYAFVGGGAEVIDGVIESFEPFFSSLGFPTESHKKAAGMLLLFVVFVLTVVMS